jgi:hypothetical protein
MLYIAPVPPKPWEKGNHAFVGIAVKMVETGQSRLNGKFRE